LLTCLSSAHQNESKAAAVSKKGGPACSVALPRSVAQSTAPDNDTFLHSTHCIMYSSFSLWPSGLQARGLCGKWEWRLKSCCRSWPDVPAANNPGAEEIEMQESCLLDASLAKGCEHVRMYATWIIMTGEAGASTTRTWHFVSYKMSAFSYYV